jgi:hypothetical protein
MVVPNRQVTINSNCTKQAGSYHEYGVLGMHNHGNCDAAMVVAGGASGNVYLWDVRYMTRGPVRQYEQPWYRKNRFKTVNCIAVEPRHNTLLSGGIACIIRWDLKTGTSFLD